MFENLQKLDTKDLLETGTSTVLKDGPLELNEIRIDLSGFKDAGLTEILLYGNDWQTLAPDSGLDAETYQQTLAWVIKEAGCPIVVLVKTELKDQPGRFEPFFVAVNLHDPRESVVIQGNTGKHVLDNKDNLFGGLNLDVYRDTVQMTENPPIQLIKKGGRYIISTESRAVLDR